MITMNPLLIGSLAAIFLTIGVCPALAQPDMVQESDSEQEAGPVEFEQVIEFDRDIHFLTLDGQDKVFPSGGYYVDAVQNGLRLKSADHEEAEAIIVQAEETTHGQSVESPEAMSMKEGEDQQVVMVLLPDGKAMQAVGSSSVIQTRGFKPVIKLGPSALQYIPKVNGIFTEPTLGALTPAGTLYVKGKYFGTPKGKINLHLSHPVPQIVPLSVEEWNDTKIKPKFLAVFPD